MSEQESSTDVATEVVDPAANIVAVTKRVAEFADFGPGLVEAYRQAKGVVFDLAKVKDNEAARKLRKTLVTTRTSIDVRRKDEKRKLRETVATKLALVDEVADKAIEFVRDLEEPLDQAIVADEERRAAEKKARDDAEKARIEALRQRVEDITTVAVRAAGLPSGEIEQKIALVGRIEVDATFEELESAANAAKANTLARLNELLTDARQREAERAEAERNKAEVERLRREAEERRKADEAREREAAQLRAREAAEQREREEAARREREQAEQVRQAQLAASQAAVGEIQRIARGALTATSVGLQAMIEKISLVKATIDCGDYAGLVESEREATTEHLRELIDQKAEQERQAAAQAEALRAAQERERRQQALADEIEVIRRQLFICQEQEHTIEQVEVRLEEVRAMDLEPDHFGVLFHSAVAVRDATVLGLEQLLAQMRNPPEPLVKVQAEPVHAGEPPVVDRNAPGLEIDSGKSVPACEIIPVEGCAPPAMAAPAPAPQPWPNERTVDQLMALLTEVVNVVKSAKRGRKDGPYSVPAADFQQMCEALTRVRLPADGYYAGDGTLMTADGKRSVFDDVDEG